VNRYVLSTGSTPATKLFFNDALTSVSLNPLSSGPSAPPSPSSSMNEKDLTPPPVSSKDENLINESATVEEEEEDGEIIHALHDDKLEFLEISPLAFSTVEELSQRVVRDGGAALLIDYGEGFPQGDTLRGFQKHKAVHAFSEPGNADITADVNFMACAQVLVVFIR
jgi:hypothetical protein